MSERPTHFRVATLVREHFSKTRQGLTREELARELGWPQTRNLPGVRRAISEGMIRYDDGGRLVPRWWER